PTQLNNSALPANQQAPDTATADEADTACCSTGDSCPTQAEFDPRSDHSYSFHKRSEDELLRTITNQKHVIASLEEELEKAKDQVASLTSQLEKSHQDLAARTKLCDRLKQKNRWYKLELFAMHMRMRAVEAEAENTQFMYETIPKDQKRIKYYTGFTSHGRVDTFWSLLEPDAKKQQL
ncbi:hypothetical protein HPB47_026856, partial [Ixodes persulcatus]